MKVLLAPLLVSVLALIHVPAASSPETVIVQIGSLRLHGVLWRPQGDGPFPAVLFNHGSYTRSADQSLEQIRALGPVFARHGYVLLALFRRGIGLSADQGTADGDLMSQAFAAEGQSGRNRVQLELLESEERSEAMAGLAFLRARPEVDARRVAVAGHSFGGSLSLIVAARDPELRAVVLFSSTARSWDPSPDLRRSLRMAAAATKAPVLFMHAANDYSTVPGTALAAERRRLGLPQRLKIYPAFGPTSNEGHNFLYSSVGIWESDVFAFLDEYVSSAKPIAHVSPP